MVNFLGEKPMKKVERPQPVSPTKSAPMKAPGLGKAPAPGGASGPSPVKKKSAVSRREELLKQLKAVEDAIAKKKKKMTWEMNLLGAVLFICFTSTFNEGSVTENEKKKLFLWKEAIIFYFLVQWWSQFYQDCWYEVTIFQKEAQHWNKKVRASAINAL